MEILRDLAIQKMMDDMREHQKNKSIENQCITNTQYLYDIMTTNFSKNVKAKAVYMFSGDNGIGKFVNHVILVKDNKTIMDSSYDTYCLKDKNYFYTFKDLMDHFDNETKNRFGTELDMRELVNTHMRFIKVAERINNGKLSITDNGEKHYNDQADYISSLFGIN
jgi:hypothetical protein